jgi:hypothetical protein
MPLLDLDKITSGLSKTWNGYLHDWDRSLRSGNYPETTPRVSHFWRSWVVAALRHAGSRGFVDLGV